MIGKWRKATLLLLLTTKKLWQFPFGTSFILQSPLEKTEESIVMCATKLLQTDAPSVVWPGIVRVVSSLQPLCVSRPLFLSSLDSFLCYRLPDDGLERKGQPYLSQKNVSKIYQAVKQALTYILEAFRINQFISSRAYGRSPTAPFLFT
jgi:hypothetical protein